MGNQIVDAGVIEALRPRLNAEEKESVSGCANWPLWQTLGHPVRVKRDALSEMWINRDP